MGTILVLLVAQEASPVTGELLRYLGPFAASVLIGGMWVKDLSQRLKSSVEREQLLSDRLVELAERSTPNSSAVPNGSRTWSPRSSSWCLP
jgi:hypothetical protein